MSFRHLSVAALAVMALGAQMAHAKPCRDDKGKFTKCEAPQKPKPCRDTKGKFTKCSASSTASAPATPPSTSKPQ
ncbi:hypothetical protein [Gluconobacter aidae]|uniref:Uncharacterized protein n=1 Tax=Gluconobacter aidae TaxID=2662454 RepID=A0A7X1VNH4_9PROT|nr:hypothetical protein [Gluconobacter aidae]MQR97977.1 hypothetical protein [Gluconobacter aidae]